MIEKYSPTRIWFHFSSSLRNLTPSEANLSASHQSTDVLSPLEITKGDLKRRGSLSPLTMHLVPGSTLETLWVGKKKKNIKTLNQNLSNPLASYPIHLIPQLLPQLQECVFIENCACLISLLRKICCF